ncbi:hypothetical protein Palpr_2135 [Paludibacter propionicigenes WB4]|uniref:Uncharacterized protein n=1 Tax=Paludibacter propionicigenes (strain DSM 17365 / JCM 13257 / WB4) TaxID=694427 RepID=E4T6C7_PALPW|nr:hypothetical protein Palpr_2135 [Paludibacter propionicigenes WB4]
MEVKIVGRISVSLINRYKVSVSFDKLKFFLEGVRKILNLMVQR